MQPSPRAETSKPPRPSWRVLMRSFPFASAFVDGRASQALACVILGKAAATWAWTCNRSDSRAAWPIHAARRWRVAWWSHEPAERLRSHVPKFRGRPGLDDQRVPRGVPREIGQKAGPNDGHSRSAHPPDCGTRGRRPMGPGSEPVRPHRPGWQGRERGVENVGMVGEQEDLHAATQLG